MALLVGGSFAIFAAALVVIVAVPGIGGDGEAGKRLAPARILSTSTDCSSGQSSVLLRVAPGKARRLVASARLVREGAVAATGSVTRRASGRRVTLRISLSPPSDQLLPYCRLVEGSSLRLKVVSRRGRETRRVTQTVEGDRYRAEPSRRIELGPVGDPVSEASGLAESRRSPGTFYTVDDSGGEAAVYVLGDDGSIRATQPLTGVLNRDWEDIALGPGRAGGSIYVGDIGDNGASRSSIAVYRIPEPELDGIPASAVLPPVAPEIVELQYPDGARDAEALIVDPSNGDLYVITKREARSRVYRARNPIFGGETVTLEYLGELGSSGVVAADACPDGQTVLVKTYFSVFAYVSRSGVESALAGQPASRLYEAQPSFLQDETVAADPWCTGYSVLPEGTGAPLARYAP